LVDGCTNPEIKTTNIFRPSEAVCQDELEERVAALELLVERWNTTRGPDGGTERKLRALRRKVGARNADKLIHLMTPPRLPVKISA
jgi:hypothetical protein